MKIAITTMIKNEHLYLNEWIQYHLSLGIDAIYIVEDSDSLSHDVSQFSNVYICNISQLVNYEDFQRRNVQRYVANYYANLLKSEYDWMGFLDVDEFLMCPFNIKDVLQKYDDKCGVQLYWHNYGANGHFYRPEGSTLVNYTKPTIIDQQDLLYYWTKSFANLKKLTRWIDVHVVEKSVLIQDAWINHYITRSFEDYCYKIYERGDVYHRVYRSFDEFFIYNPEFNREECTKYVEEKYGTIEEYIQTQEKWFGKVDLKTVKHSGPILQLYQTDVDMMSIPCSIDVDGFIAKNCGKLHLNDPTGLYSIKFSEMGFTLSSKRFRGEGVVHKLTIWGENGGKATLNVHRYDVIE